MNIKILSDSTCDLPQELLEKYNITMVPLCVIKDGQGYSDGINITPAEIFDHVANGGDLCSTAAINIGEYADWFAKYASDYDGVIHINLSAEFSSCHQNARLAAAEFDNVRVIDSRNLSTGQGLVAYIGGPAGSTIQGDVTRMTEAIDQAFKQSEYLKNK